MYTICCVGWQLGKTSSCNLLENCHTPNLSILLPAPPTDTSNRPPFGGWTGWTGCAMLTDELWLHSCSEVAAWAISCPSMFSPTLPLGLRWDCKYLVQICSDWMDVMRGRTDSSHGTSRVTMSLPRGIPRRRPQSAEARGNRGQISDMVSPPVEHHKWSQVNEYTGGKWWKSCKVTVAIWSGT